jgi:hypothetical protein
MLSNLTGFLLAWKEHFQAKEILQIFSVKRVTGPEGRIMTQCTIICIVGFHLRLHFFHQGDGELFHCHPRHFVSIGICGEYLERLSTGEQRRVQFGTFTFRRATDKHNVTPTVLPCVTLALTTPVVRQWNKGGLDVHKEKADGKI